MPVDHAEPAGSHLRGIRCGDGGDPWEGWTGALRPRTRGEYCRDIEEWQTWLAGRSKSLFDARVGDVNGWTAALRRRGWKNSTVARKLSAVSSYYAWAREEGLTTVDPLPRRRPKVRHDPTRRLGLPIEAVDGLLAAAEPGLELALISLMLHTGVRVSEAVGADIGHIRMAQQHRVLYVEGKGGKPRTPPVPDRLWAVLADHLGGRRAGPVFLGRDGSRMSRFAAWRVVGTVGGRAGVVVHPHLFRHTAAVLMIRAGSSLREVQEVLGHAGMDTTAGYMDALVSLDRSPVYALDRLLAQPRGGGQ